ncbi:MAG: glycosyltransferase [Planctomycetota bacterium]
MSKPAVSVIIPTHNRAALLREALDSVAEQTWRDYETIVVDDGSTEDIARDIADHPARPMVVRQQHSGPAAARNRGLREAQADTIAFLDSDDLWHAAKLETFCRALEREPDTRVFYGPMEPIDAGKRRVPGRTKPCHAGRITHHLFCSSFVHVPTVVCRKDILIKAGGFDESLPVCEDYDLWLRVSIDEPFGLIEQPLAMRRLHDNRLSKHRMSRNLAVKAAVLCKFYESPRAKPLIPEARAHARLARVHFVAARAAFRNGEYHRAIELCRASRRFGANPLRAIPLALSASALSHFDRNDQDVRRIPVQDQEAEPLLKQDA